MEKGAPLISNPIVKIRWAIVLAACAGYFNSFSSRFLFDDSGSITDNPTIRHLWPIWPLFSPPINGTPVSGRPLLNFSFALNYAWGGNTEWGYHLVNFIIHVLAGLALFGVLRRTLSLPVLPAFLQKDSLPLAGSAAALWVVHPLTTESVSYISQRAESLMGLFYLLTFYCFIRGATEERKSWRALTVACCLAGMATKEVMISAPLLLFLYDRTFLAGTFAAAWQRRGPLHLVLGSTWILLAAEMIHVGNRGNSIGTNATVNCWNCALTQSWAIIHYLRLCFWPHPLTFDYGNGVISSAGRVVPDILLLLVLTLATLAALWRRPTLGFLGAWFFIILAPTSSFVPVVQQTIAEHRMYLPLAAVLMFMVLGLYRWTGSHFLFLVIGLIGILSVITAHRNLDYLNGFTIWSDSLARYPDNPRAHTNLGMAFAESNQPEKAIEEFKKAIELNPRLAEAHNNLAVLEEGRGQTQEALAEYQEALRVQPGFTKAQENLERLQAGPRLVPDK